MWQSMVEQAVRKAPIRVVDLDLKSGTVSYSRRIRQNHAIQKISGDREIVRADLVNRFVNEMSYAPEQIELDREIDLPGEEMAEPGKVRVDVVVHDVDGRPFFFANVREPGKFSSETESGYELIQIAEAEYRNTGNAVHYLFYYTVVVKNDELTSDSVIINFQHFVSGLDGVDPVTAMHQEKPESGPWAEQPNASEPGPVSDEDRDRRRAVVNRYKKRAYPVLLRITDSSET